MGLLFTIAAIVVPSGAIILIGGLIIREQLARQKKPVDLSPLPRRFVVFDLETTGLSPDRHEIIEIGAIRVDRDGDLHDTFSVLVKPDRKISAAITRLTGITNARVESDGVALGDALAEFRAFVADLPLVAYNARFDLRFLRAASEKANAAPFDNEACCALAMARRAWPGRLSYKLIDLSRDAGISLATPHRALADCERALRVYVAAAAKLRRHRI